MKRASVWLVSAAAVATLVLVSPVAAQDDPATYTANVLAGTCDDPGAVEAPLNEVVAPSGGPQGAADATVAATSFTAVPLSLDELLGGEFAIDVRLADDEDAVACGEIGGVVSAQGAVTIGLRPEGDSGVSGIAYLTEDGSQTGISTFVAETGAAAEPEAEAHAEQSSEQDASPEGDDGSGEELDEETYVVNVRRQVTLLVGSLQRVDALFEEPRVDDAAWINQLTAELTLWQILYDEALETTPPAEYADFNEQYLGALELLDSASQDVFEALESGDEARLGEASAKIDQAIELLRELSGDDEGGTPAA